MRLEQLVHTISQLFGHIAPLKFFTITAAVFGLILVLITPPFQGGDEPLHFYRAYQVSQLNLAVDANEGNDYGGILPKSLQKTVNLTTNNSSLGNLGPDEKYDLGRTARALGIHPDPINKQWTNFTATALYPPVAYFPQAFGVAIGRALHTPPLIMMYLGRIMNLIAWIGLIAFSIRLMPIKKWAIVFIGLLPVALSQAASLSADILTIGTFAVFVAAIFYLIQSKKPLSNLQLGGLLLLMSVMTLCKQIMIVFLPLIFLVPQTRFGSKKRAYIIKASFIAVAAMCYLLWLYVIRNVDMKSVFSHHQMPSEQIAFVLHHPLHFLGTLWHTYFFTFGDSITRSFIGTFGWGDVGLSLIFIVIGYIGLLAVMAIRTPGERVNDWIGKWQRWLMWAVWVAYGLAVSMALYTYYNPVGAPIIAGLQGRYFLPLGLLAIPLLMGKYLTASQAVYRTVAMGVPLLLLIASTISILYRYYAG